MKALFAQIGVIAVMLLIVAIAVFGIGDKTVLVSSPSVVLEGFLRNLASNRYSRGVPYLTADLAAETEPAELEELMNSLTTRTGAITDVRGEGEIIHDDEAEATAVLKTDSAGTVAITLPMKRSSGVWKIASLQGLVQPGARR